MTAGEHGRPRRYALQPEYDSVVDRSREPIWLYFGAIFGGVGAALLGVAAAFDGGSKVPYALWTSVPMIVAYVMFSLSVVCAVCAVRDVPIPYPISHRAAGALSESGLGALVPGSEEIDKSQDREVASLQENGYIGAVDELRWASAFTERQDEHAQVPPGGKSARTYNRTLAALLWGPPSRRRVLTGAGITLLIAAVLAAVPAVLPGHAPSNKPPAPAIDCASGSITLIGSAFGPIAQRAARVYMGHCKHAIIHVESGKGIDSADGVTQVEEAVKTHSGKAGSMIAMYDGVTTLAKGLTPDPVGVMIYSVVAHTDAIPKSQISVTELEDLYTKHGGLKGKVGVTLQAGSANRQALLWLWHEKEPGPKLPGFCPAPSGQAVSYSSCKETSYAAVLEFVNGTPNAIGYLAVDTELDGDPTGYPYTSTIYTNTSVISIGDAAPTPKDVHNGSYSFVAVEHLYLPPHPTAVAHSFLAYLPRYLTSYQSPDFTTCSNAPQRLAAECAAPR